MTGVFAPRPSQGPHKLRECIPVNVILRDKLKYALTNKECMQICMERCVKVDGKIRTDQCFPTGFMEVVELDAFSRRALVGVATEHHHTAVVGELVEQRGDQDEVPHVVREELELVALLQGELRKRHDASIGDDRVDRPVLGRQRNLAGAGRRAVAGGVPGSTW